MTANTPAAAKPAKPTPLDWRNYKAEKKEKKAQEDERKRKREEDAHDVPPAKRSRNARRRLKQKAVADEKAEAEKKAAEWLATKTEPDFGAADDEKPKVRLPLRPAETQD